VFHPTKNDPGHPQEIIELIFHQSSRIIKNHQESSRIIKNHQSIMSATHQGPTNNTHPLLTACTRFNNKTWQEYQDWKAKNQQSYEQIYQRPLKCIYGSPREMSHKKMPPHAKILVIEMNNDENQIKGIGVIQNKTASEVYRTPPRPSPVTSVSDLPLSVTPQSAQNSLALETAVGGRNPQIKGIGVIQNKTASEVYRTPPRPSSVTSVSDLTLSVPDLPQPPPRIVFNHLFSDRNYTRYIYIGNEYYATKEDLERNHTADAQYINEQLATLVMKETSPSSPPTHPPQQTLFQSLERLLFKGAKHMKRGTGITLCSVAPA
jgi:hypothetical protein